MRSFQESQGLAQFGGLLSHFGPVPLSLSCVDGLARIVRERSLLWGMVRTNDTLVVTAERGGGDMTAAERVADLLSSPADGAFEKQETDARRARMQWQPTPQAYAENMQHVHGRGSGRTHSQPAIGFGTVVNTETRVVAPGNAPSIESQVKMAGPASQTKDWRKESGRIGRYWAHPDFKLEKYGTWSYEAAGDNPYQKAVDS